MSEHYASALIVLVGVLIGSVVGALVAYWCNIRARKQRTALELSLQFSSILKEVDLFERCVEQASNATGKPASKISQLEYADVTDTTPEQRRDAIYSTLHYLEHFHD